MRYELEEHIPYEEFLKKAYNYGRYIDNDGSATDDLYEMLKNQYFITPDANVPRSFDMDFLREHNLTLQHFDIARFFKDLQEEAYHLPFDMHSRYTPEQRKEIIKAFWRGQYDAIVECAEQIVQTHNLQREILRRFRSIS